MIPYPADLDLMVINETFNRQFQLLDDAHHGKLFRDCVSGSLPALSMAYGLPVMVATCIEQCRSLDGMISHMAA